MPLSRLHLLSCRALSLPSRALSSLPGPAPNWDFLLDPQNTDSIRSNCAQRKSQGDIDRLLQLHSASRLDPREETQRELLREALKIPNSSHPKTPIGSESKARLLQEYNPPCPSSSPSAVSIGRTLSQLRLDKLSLSAGHRTYFFVGGLARLERALVQLALSRLLGASFTQISVPDVLPSDIIERCGFPTRGERTQVYHLENNGKARNDLCLAGTAEMSLAGCYAGRTFQPEELPLRLCAVSRCFRREVPEQEEPLYRVHQFTKVEMFSISDQQSSQLLEEFVDLQVAFLTDLGLCFRVLEMPTEELGAPAHRKIDIEVWMPGSKKFGEVSSASDCSDYQSRRLHLRIGPQRTFASTTNATAAAVPRLVKAILESHVTENGSVAIPQVLWPWMGGLRVLKRQHPPVTSTYIQKLRQ